MKSYFIFAFWLAFSSQVNSHEIPNTITLASTQWCPYACEHQPEQPGIIHEYLTQVLQDKGIDLKVEFNPWHESVDRANSGQVHGLLTATPEEAPGLLFTQTPTADYQVCFIAKSDSKWLYKGNETLAAINLGSIEGYGYGSEIDPFINEHANAPNMKILKDGGIAQLNEMLFNNEIDTYLDDSLVVLWLLKDTNIKVKLAGCLKRNPFYIAINSDFPWAKDFIKMMNETLKENINLHRLSTIKQTYR